MHRSAVFLPVLLASMAYLPARSADFTVSVDAREAPRRILHVKQTFSGLPGGCPWSVMVFSQDLRPVLPVHRGRSDGQ